MRRTDRGLVLLLVLLCGSLTVAAALTSGWLRTHYDWAIRTFWIGMLYSVIAALLVVVLIGIPLLIAVAVLIIVRVVIGWQKLSKGEPITNPQSWLI